MRLKKWANALVSSDGMVMALRREVHGFSRVVSHTRSLSRFKGASFLFFKKRRSSGVFHTDKKLCVQTVKRNHTCMDNPNHRKGKSWAVAGRRYDGTLFALQRIDIAELDENGKINRLIEIQPRRKNAILSYISIYYIERIAFSRLGGILFS
jgi:hypothetical protein